MMRSMFAAISGLKAHQVMLDVTAGDIANVNTVGYKSARMTFRDSLAQLQRGGAAPGPGQAGSNAAQVGLGSQVGSIDNLMTGGALQTTGNNIANAGNADYTRQTGQVGADVQQATNQVDTTTALTNALQNQRQSVSGVSLDEEMTNLITFQRSYQASARALSAMDDMLDQLINRTGRVGL